MSNFSKDVFGMAPVKDALEGLDERPPSFYDDCEAAEDEFDLDFASKKKKKKSKTNNKKRRGYDNGTMDWPGYPYTELLQRIFETYMEDSDSSSGDACKRQYALKPPLIARVGTKKTAIVNFDEICKNLKRPNQSVCMYLLAELGTIGSIDSNTHLIIKGRFLQKQIESILKKYCREYVVCSSCRSFDTDLIKESRLLFLLCNACNSKCSVQGVKTGFQAVTSKRKIMRV